MEVRGIFYIVILLIVSCSFHKKSKNYSKQPIEFNLKVINRYNEEPPFIIEYRTLYYEIKNNTEVSMYFNILNFNDNIKDTSGLEYHQGFFKLLTTQFPNQDYTHCSLGLDFDIYPFTREDTLKNIVKINAHSSFSDTLRAYGYDFKHDDMSIKESLPYCFKKDAKNKNKIKFQVLYDNTMQDVRADTIWKGKLLSNVAIWE